MESGSETRTNPWRTIWTRPRETLRSIADSPDPERWLIALAAVGGIVRTLERADLRNLGDGVGFAMVLFFALFIGTLQGLLVLYLGGWLIRWVGGLFGGRASTTQVRAAIGWANAPMILALLLWIPRLVIFGGELFTTKTPRLDQMPALSYLRFAFNGVEIALAVWGFLILLVGLGEVQRFSWWKSLVSVIVGLVLAAIPVGAVLYAAYLITIARSA